MKKVEEKQKYTDYAYIELNKSIVDFEDRNKVLIKLGKETTMYISKYDLTNYEFKPTFIFKPKKEKEYVIYNHTTKEKANGNAEEITKFLEKYALRVSLKK